MTTCTSCGHDVTGKKFCPECGTPVQTEQAMTTCPHCNGTVKVGAAFCMHCGSPLGAQALSATAVSQPATRQCPACRADVPSSSAFCTNCGQNMQASIPSVPPAPAAPAFCGSCGAQNNPGARFCNSCGQPLGSGVLQPAGGYAQPQSGPYQQPSQYQYAAQPYPPAQQAPYAQQSYTAQPPYATGYPSGTSYPPNTAYPPQQAYPPQTQGPYDPMLGQQPMVLRCPVCQAMAPVGTTNCLSCHTSLAGVVPTPATMGQQGQQQGGLGGMLQGNAGKYAMGALGGAAAVIGGEMLLHGVENSLEGGGNWGDGYPHHHHHHHDEGLLGGGGGLLGDLNDLGIL